MSPTIEYFLPAIIGTPTAILIAGIFKTEGDDVPWIGVIVWVALSLWPLTLILLSILIVGFCAYYLGCIIRVLIEFDYGKRKKRSRSEY